MSPHIRGAATTSKIMLMVLVAMLPAFVASIFLFGARAALVVVTCAAASVICEWVYEKAMKKPVTINDFSAIVTGVLLAFNLPVNVPLWQAVFGCIVAIILVKQLFGGLGKNFANPAITARIVMFLAFSVSMMKAALPVDAATGASVVDAISGATPLALLARGDTAALPKITDMLLGLRGGALGETCVIALLAGGIFLVATRIIKWHTPVAFIATVFAFTAILGQNPVYHVLSGGLLLGAIFMATDYVTTPQTNAGRLVFGIGAGFLTVVFRIYGSYPEGVSFAILLMNILTPYINKFTENKPLGALKK
ncbi:MAG: RnfABCDGE type electron transport complex subunit D [Oscillospiraceae bacterium]|nr:RnfABCDGE type electron transport complex subunit D [Oscillospiraceae bacterium]